ncbi:hypothetical protein VTJ49DRAFT_4040 [Mycothermus thermophilus]|uniref:Uncharacterized protein n=1 Tax=Humicola insolens TaxID=85995 RepID=A0ABR3V6A1_HUMIN
MSTDTTNDDLTRLEKRLRLKIALERTEDEIREIKLRKILHRQRLRKLRQRIRDLQREACRLEHLVDEEVANEAGAYAKAAKQRDMLQGMEDDDRRKQFMKQLAWPILHEEKPSSEEACGEQGRDSPIDNSRERMDHGTLQAKLPGGLGEQ